MLLRCWKRLFPKAAKTVPARSPAERYRVRPRVERLEERTVPAALPPGFLETTVASGLALPTSMSFAPDGRLFVTEKGGVVKVLKNGAVQPTPFLQVPVNTFWERGLQSIAFDPNFASNGFVYVYYTRGLGRPRNRISRFTVNGADPDRADPSSEVVILDNIPASAGYHNGGAMRFGPDGKLYVGTGDAGAKASAQRLRSLSGKVLRLDVANYPHIIPRDNPFVRRGGARKEVWAYGFRNPFSMAVVPGLAQLFVNDVGENRFEEVNRVSRGGNYGWPNAEGPSTLGGFRNPLYSYAHRGDGGGGIPGGAVTGAVFYTDNKFPSVYQGAYFFADYVRGFIRVLSPAAGKKALEFATKANGPVDLDVAPDGSLYYLAFGTGTVNRVSFTGDPNRQPTASASASTTSGPGPLSVNFSAAGSSDPDGEPLTYTWDFGDGTTATGAGANHVYQANGTYTAQLTVTDSRGASASAKPIQVSVGNYAPVGRIVRPVKGRRLPIGALVRLEAKGFDAEDGALPNRAFRWEVVLHHEAHTHPFRPSIVGRKASFRVPDREGAHADGIFYRVYLHVTDSAGLVHTSFRDVFVRG